MRGCGGCGRPTGTQLGLLIEAQAGEDGHWIAETSAGGEDHDSWEKALADLEGDKRKKFVVVELGYAEPIGRPLREEDMDLWDAADRFLAGVVIGHREHLEIEGTKLTRVKVGLAERET